MQERKFTQLQSVQIDYRKILLHYLKFWYLFLFAIMVCLGLAFLYLYYATPQYRISSTLLVKDDEKGSDFSRNAVFSDLENYNSAKSIDNEVEVLRSKNLMLKILSELSLHTTYYIENGYYRYKEIYGRELPIKVTVSSLNPSAFLDLEDQKIKLNIKLKGEAGYELEEEGQQAKYYNFGEEIKRPYGVFTVVSNPQGMIADSSIDKTVYVHINNIHQLAEIYNEKLEVTVVSKRANIISISLNESVPDKGKDIINKLIETYNKEAVEDKNLIAANTIQFIDERLGYLVEELTELEKGVEDYKRKNEITDVSSEARLYLENTSTYKKQLVEIGNQIEVLASIEKYMLTQRDKYEMVPSSLSIQDPTLLALVSKYNEVQQDRERMLRTTHPNNPMVENMGEQLVNLRQNILENIKNIKDGLEIMRKNLQASSRSFESQIQKVPVIERELLEINRRQSTKQEHYLYLLKKREESALSLAATTVSNSRIIDPAMASLKPVKPQKLMVLFIALVSGFGFPFAFIFIKDKLNFKVQHKEDIKQLTEVPILGEICWTKNKDSARAMQEPEFRWTPIVEQMRLIRCNLQFATSGSNQVILATSSMSGEGKTFFCLNLGFSLSMTGKKVVILEFDLRKPALLKSLKIPDEAGICDYLMSNDLSIDEIVKPSTIVPQLFVVGSGSVVLNPAELMMSPKVGQLINELKKWFDHIIIDTAPIGQVADAYALAPYSDATVFMVKYGYTTKDQIDSVNEIYMKEKFKNPMLVLNDAKKESGYGYGSYFNSAANHKNKMM